MKNKKRFSMQVCFLMILLLVISSVGEAREKFPSKPLTIIVCYSPGGGMDQNARAVMPHLEKFLGQPVVIINKTGGAGTIGLREGAKARPDGYTMTSATGSLTMAPYTVAPDVHYRNYDPIIYLGISPAGLTVRSDAPWNSLKESLDDAKANPGKIRMANVGTGGSMHIRTLAVEQLAGVKFTHVPFKGSARGLMALVGGHVEGISAGVADGLHLVKGGKLKILAVTAPERLSIIPSIPTFEELGIDLESGSWYSYLMPKGTPKDRIKIVHDALKKTMASPQYMEYSKGRGILNRYLGPEDLLKYLEKEDRIWSRVIETAGMRKFK